MIKEKLIAILHERGYDLITAAELATNKVTEIQAFFSRYPKTTSYTFVCCNLYITIGKS